MSTYAPQGNLTITNEAVPLAQEQRVLLIGKNENENTPDKTLYQNITVESANSLFGEYSLLADAVREFRVVNETTILDCIPVNVTTGVGAKASIKITGIVLGEDTVIYPIKISLVKKKSGTAQDNKGNGFATVMINGGDDALTVATKIKDSLDEVLTNEDPITISIMEAEETSKSKKKKKEEFPIEGAEQDVVINRAEEELPIGFAEVLVESKIESIVSNTFLFDVEGLNLVPGLQIIQTGFTGGISSFDFKKEELETLIDGIKYKICVIDDSLDLGVLQSILEERKSIVGNVDLSGIGVSGQISTVPILKDLAEEFKSDILAIISDTKENGLNPSMGTPSHILASNFIALISLREETGAVISNIMQNINSDAQIGGVQTLGLPYHATICNNLPYRMEKFLVGYTNELTNIQKIECQNAGICCFQQDKSISKVTLGSTPTTGYAETGIWLEDIELELILSSELFALAENNFKQTGFTNGSIPSNNNGFLDTTTIKNFFIVNYFPEKRNQGLLDNSQASIDITTGSLTVEFNNTTETLDLSYTSTTARKLRNFNINIRYSKNI